MAASGPASTLERSTNLNPASGKVTILALYWCLEPHMIHMIALLAAYCLPAESLA